MAINIVQLFNQNTNMEVAMKVNDYLKDLFFYTDTPIESLYDLSDDQKVNFAVAIFEEDGREELAEILYADGNDSDPICTLLSFLQQDDPEKLYDFGQSIKKAFVSYYKGRMADYLNRYIEDRSIAIYEDRGAKSYKDSTTGETYYSI